MKKFILLSNILFTGVIMAQTGNMDIVQDNIQETIKIKNVKHGKLYTQNIYILKSPITQAASTKKSIVYYAFPNGNRFNSGSKIMIKFKDASVNISEIENKYHLKLQRKMHSGDYLFTNLNANTLEVINTLLKEEATHIERITPDLILNVKAM